MNQRGARTIGRVQAVQILAPAPSIAPSFEGMDVRNGDQPGQLLVVAVDGDGADLGSIKVFTESHGDPFYGRYSVADRRFAYLSKLEVTPAARGRGLGTMLLSAARAAALDATGAGVKSLVAPGNSVSLACHARAGFDPPDLELRGVRLGSRVLWLSRRVLV